MAALDNVASVLHCAGTGDESSVDARHERVRAQAVGAVNGVVGLAAGVKSFDVGLLVEVNPQAAHGVVHARKDLHGHVAGIVAHELLVDFEDAFQLAVERGAIDVRQVEIDHRRAVDAQVVLEHDLMNGAGSDVTRYEVPVFRVPLFQEVPAIAFGNALEVALVAWLSRDPHPATFAAGRLRHQSQLVFARNARRVNLDELAVSVVSALLIERRLRRSGADHRVGGLAEDGSVAASGDDDRLGRER